MSKEHKLNWLAVIVLAILITCIGYLVALQLIRGLNSEHGGLECISNCQGFEQTVKSLK